VHTPHNPGQTPRFMLIFPMASKFPQSVLKKAFHSSNAFWKTPQGKKVLEFAPICKQDLLFRALMKLRSVYLPLLYEHVPKRMQKLLDMERAEPIDVSGIDTGLKSNSLPYPLRELPQIKGVSEGGPVYWPPWVGPGEV